jgi:hypothetical protein
MKTPFVFLFALLVFTGSGAFSQCGDSTMVTVHSQQEDPDTMQYSYKLIQYFNPAELQTLRIYYSWLNGNWQPYSKDSTFYLYDTLIQSHENFVWDGFQWQPLLLETWQYVNNTLPSLYLKQTWTGTAWSDTIRTVYTYNGFFQLLSKTSQHYNGSVWVNNSESINVFDGTGNLLDSTSLAYTNGQVSYGYKYLHFYDGSDDTLIIEKRRNATDTTWYNNQYFRQSRDGLLRIYFREN